MKIFTTFVLFIICMLSFAQNESIKKADKFIENKKYESAYNVLNKADPNNEVPEITIAKSELFLDYFVTSIMHQMFAITDLEENQDLMEIRGSQGSFSMYSFPPDSILMKLIEKFPENYKLNKALAYFYHEAHLKYGQEWLLPDSIVIDRFFNNYKIAYDNGIYDYWSLYGMGYAFMINQDYQNAITYFEKSIELKSDYPSSYYNLAYAYLYSDQREKGIANAKTAMELYDYPTYKADAARMIAVMYKELNEYEQAYDYYKMADKIQPNDYYNLKPLLDIEITLDKESYSSTTEEFFLLAPDNPTIYQDMMEIYWSYNKPDELIDFLSSQHEKYKSDNKVNGNLYFYTGIIQYDKEDFQKAKMNFEKSKILFADIFEPDHVVFQVIDSYLKEL